MREKKLIGVVAAFATAGILAGASVNIAAAAPVQEPAPAPRVLAHGLGAKLDHPRSAPMHTAQPVFARAAGAALPKEASLPTIAPGDQGNVGSCVAWATTHSGYGVLMNEQNIKGGPMAPMYIYAQITKGNDQGTYGSVALDMTKEQGVDVKSDYWQGDFDYTTQPTQQQREKAGHYKLSGYNTLGLGQDLKAGVQDSMSQGMPVAIAIPVHESFMNIDSQTAADYSYMPGDESSDPIAGGHEITIVGYNEKGVTIENSWGENWGNKGFVNVSWDFMSSQVQDAIAMGKIVQS
jgi:C1A family cysteine protease